LSEDVRRLAGTFEITFEITVPPAKAADLAAKVEAAKTEPETFKTQFTEVAKAKLVEAGVDQATVNNVTVSALTATPVYTTTTTGSEGVTNGAYQGVASMVVIIAIQMLLRGM